MADEACWSDEAGRKLLLFSGQKKYVFLIYNLKITV